MSPTLFLAAALIAQAPAATAADAELAAQVRTLLQQLDAPQRAARDEAERALLELGSPALPLLATLPASASAEVVSRVDRVRAALYRNRAAASLEASTVTLDAEDAPLGDVLAEFEKQTGNKLVDYRRQFGQQAGERRLTLRLDNQPFWKALDALAATAGMEVYHFSGGDGLALVDAPPEARHGVVEGRNVVYAGAFRLALRRLVATREVGEERPVDLQIDWEVAWEPRLKPLFFTLRDAAEQAVDDRGEPLAPQTNDFVVEIPPPAKASRIEASLRYKAPPRSVTTLREFGGSLEVLMPAEPLTFRFDRLAAGVAREQRAGAVSTAIEPRPQLGGEGVAVALRLRYDDAANALESHRGWFYKNACYLEAPDGTQTKPASVELARQAQNELTLNFSFEPTGDWRGQTLVYQTPADLVVLPIKFSFRDLPLP